MTRSLDQDQVRVTCSNRHPPKEMDPAGYMALKEAGAGLTILAYECRACFRRLYVTSEVPVSRPAGVDISSLDSGDVE